MVVSRQQRTLTLDVLAQEAFVEDFAENLGLQPGDELDENQFVTLFSVR